MNELLDRVKYAPCSGVVGTFEELPAKRVKLVAFVLSLIVALALYRRSVGWIPTGSPV